MKENGTMNWLEQVHQMKNRDIRTIEQHELQELPQDVVEHGLPQEERLKNLLDMLDYVSRYVWGHLWGCIGWSII